MFRSEHEEGSDAWHDDLEAWMRSQGIPVTDENLFLEREKIMIAVGRFIPGDMRFFHELERADEDKSKMIVFDDGPMQRRLRSLYSPELPESADDEL